jgi:GxxExxY protein
MTFPKRSAPNSPLSAEEEALGRRVVDAAYQVHRALGPGLLESVYETCFCHELHKHGLNFQRQVVVPVVYDGLQFAEGFRLDVLIDDRVICELKATNDIAPVFLAQLITWLRLTRKRLGYLINFNVPIVKHGIKRVVV